MLPERMTFIMEKCYIISYDRAEEGDYNALHKAIQRYEAWAHITESTWAVLTEDNAEVIRDHLNRYLSHGSSLFVVSSGGEAAWRNVFCRSEWLKRSL